VAEEHDLGERAGVALVDDDLQLGRAGRAGPRVGHREAQAGGQVGGRRVDREAQVRHGGGRERLDLAAAVRLVGILVLGAEPVAEGRRGR
jgi:hypothetical protein